MFRVHSSTGFANSNNTQYVRGRTTSNGRHNVKKKKIYYYEKQYIVIDLVVFHLKMEQNIMKTGIKSN